MLFTWAAAAFGIWAVSTVTLSEAVSVAASAAVFAVSVTASVVIFAVSCALEAVACPQAAVSYTHLDVYKRQLHEGTALQVP